MVLCGKFRSVLRGHDILAKTKPAIQKLLMAMAPCETGKGMVCACGFIVHVLQRDDRYHRCGQLGTAVLTQTQKQVLSAPTFKDGLSLARTSEAIGR